MPVLSRNYFWAISVVRRPIYPFRPTNAQDVSYITQESGKATLWEMGKDGSNARVVTSFGLLPLAQHLSWSPDGRYLAIQATLSCALLQGKSHALLLLDTRSNMVSTLVSPDEITVDELHWSPPSHSYPVT